MGVYDVVILAIVGLCSVIVVMECLEWFWCKWGCGIGYLLWF